MSHEYRHVLVAVDLTRDSHLVLERALPIAERNGATISIIHALEPLGFAYGGDIPMDVTTLQDQLDEHARTRLAEIADPSNIPRERQHIIVGMPDSEIHRFAEEHGVDLIVVGSHGRTGFALLLGSTSSGVLRGAKCDVLAVRVGQEGDDAQE
ncbi:universal stress protein [Halotalea alkalilenta]|uniref:Universal stress protein n=1 Tax=Halotalea alkalilenta TaxID=376489 RepID=A0A172YGX6_9GAMM|nr:universal stress protein [Halotalea alkalilenta]ANF58473.1 universal stress protein UspA [Halotalea alkalilenta]